MQAIPNTFGLNCNAIADVAFASDACIDFLQAQKNTGLPLIPLGSASNILFADEAINAIFLRSASRDLQCIDDECDGASVLLRVGAGMIWHTLVRDSLARNWFGLENLSLIPGTVGASPIQNIGAYGVEVSEWIERVHAIDLATGERLNFDKISCNFGYRDSIFKQHYKDKLLITAVDFRLSKKDTPKSGYDTLAQYLKEKDYDSLSARNISDAVIAVRRSRLPDPTQIGNAGSFFKNPMVSEKVLDVLRSKYDVVPNYPQPDGQIKLAAGWLIEQCGLKGAVRGNAGIHDKQALVLVNRGGASGAELINLAREVKYAVFDKFSVVLEHEVRILNKDANDIFL